MNGSANRLLLACVAACAVGALAIALGASGVAGAVLTAGIVGIAYFSASRTPVRGSEPWHPVRVMTRAALLAVAVTAGAALVAFGMNQGTSPATSNVGGDEAQRYPAPGATFAPAPNTQKSPEAEPSPVEESLTESPTETPTADDKPGEPTREPKPTPSPDEPSPSPTPTPSPSPSPTPPSPTPSGGGCLLGLICPPKG